MVNQQHQQQTSSTEVDESTYKFGKLMGIRFDAQENALYLNDFLLDKIEKLKFAWPSSSPTSLIGQLSLSQKSNHHQFRMASLEPILKSDYLSTALSHIALNPIMSVEYDGFVYWADYEEGIRTSELKSTCFRSIYKVKEPLALRLVHIPTMMSSSLAGVNGNVLASHDSKLFSPVRLFDSNADDRSLSGIGLKSLNVANKLKYPPDFLSYFYNNLANSSALIEAESLKRFDSTFNTASLKYSPSSPLSFVIIFLIFNLNLYFCS